MYAMSNRIGYSRSIAVIDNKVVIEYLVEQSKKYECYRTEQKRPIWPRPPTWYPRMEAAPPVLEACVRGQGQQPGRGGQGED